VPLSFFSVILGFLFLFSFCFSSAFFLDSSRVRSSSVFLFCPPLRLAFFSGSVFVCLGPLPVPVRLFDVYMCRSVLFFVGACFPGLFFALRFRAWLRCVCFVVGFRFVVGFILAVVLSLTGNSFWVL